MSNKIIGALYIMLGVMVLVASLAADAIGIGDGEGIGWKQWLGGTLGLIIAAGGVWLIQSRST